MTEQNNIEQKVEEVGKTYHFSADVIEKVKDEFSDSGQLNKFIDRIERLEEEKSELVKDIREIYAEAKGAGFDVKVMRQVIRLRKMDPADRAETEFLRDEYKKLVGISE
jgi:uncharacterized protein (UPF0335 family)